MITNYIATNSMRSIQHSLPLYAIASIAVNSYSTYFIPSFSIHHPRKNTFQLNFAKVKLFIQECLVVVVVLVLHAHFVRMYFVCGVYKKFTFNACTFQRKQSIPFLPDSIAIAAARVAEAFSATCEFVKS